MENEIITAESVNIESITERNYSRLDMAKNLVVLTVEDIQEADKILVGLSADISAAKAALKPMRDSTTTAWKAGTELEGRIVKPLEEAKKSLADRRGLAFKRIQEEAAAAVAEKLDEGDMEGAEDLMLSAPVIASNGVSSRDTWKAEGWDIEALIKAAAKSPKTFARFLQFNESALNTEARMQKDKFDVPGCKAIQGFSATVRTAAKPYGSGIGSRA